MKTHKYEEKNSSIKQALKNNISSKRERGLEIKTSQLLQMTFVKSSACSCILSARTRAYQKSLLVCFLIIIAHFTTNIKQSDIQ